MLVETTRNDGVEVGNFVGDGVGMHVGATTDLLLGAAVGECFLVSMGGWLALQAITGSSMGSTSTLVGAAVTVGADVGLADVGTLVGFTIFGKFVGFDVLGNFVGFDVLVGWTMGI